MNQIDPLRRAFSLARLDQSILEPLVIALRMIMGQETGHGGHEKEGCYHGCRDCHRETERPILSIRMGLWQRTAFTSSRPLTMRDGLAPQAFHASCFGLSAPRLTSTIAAHG